MPTAQHIASLLIKCLREDLTPAEADELQAWMAESDSHRETAETFLQPDKLEQGIHDHWVEGRIWQRLEGLIEIPVVPLYRRRIWRGVAAAAIITLLGIGAWWMNRNSVQPAPPLAVATAPADVAAPGRSRATLTLSNGQKIFLDSAASGTLAREGKMKIQRTEGGRIQYSSASLGEVGGVLIYNTLSNPRGSPIVSVTLSDGTKVWLNAESSIRYPAFFAAGDRTVEMTGEAYFEVSKDPARPFKVLKDRTTVEVLGTAFNVNAYGDEPALRVTLLSGKVRVALANQLTLKPGEQAVVTGAVERAPNPNLETVMAWKNGEMALSQSTVTQIMREIRRWYDVDIRYSGAIPDKHFYGSIDRNVPLSSVLKALEAYGVTTKFEPAQKTIIVQ